MAANALQGFQLSPQQRRLWEVAHHGGTHLYATRASLVIAGDLDAAALRRAVAAVVARHESLRTTFVRLPGMAWPLQTVGEEGLFWEAERDLSALAPARRREVIASLYREAPAIDLENGPLVHALCIRCAADRHILLLGLSALSADAASLDHIAEEIAGLYRGAALAEPIQYIDVSEWQNEALASAATEAMRGQWQQQGVAGGVDLELPFERRQVAVGHFDSVPVPLAGDLAVRTPERLHTACAADLLLVCWQILLSRLARRSDLTLGLTVKGRGYAELARVVGLLAKVIPLQAAIDEGVQLRDLVASVRAAVGAAQERQDFFSWEALARPSAHHEPVAFLPYGFVCEERPTAYAAAGANGANGAGIVVTLGRSRTWSDRFRAQLCCTLLGGALGAELHYDSSALDRSQASRLASRLAVLVEGALARPDATLRELDDLPDAERQQVVREVNDTALALPALCLHQLVEQQVVRTPDRRAVSYEEAVLSYAELDRGANRLARCLRRLGVGPEVTVAVELERSLDLPVVVLAVLKAGGAYLPLDPGYPAERRAFMLADTRPAVLLTRGCRQGARPQPGLAAVDLDSVDLAGESDTAFDPGVFLDSPAYVIYTSGSTGRPKGVSIPHRGIVNRLLWMLRVFPLGAGDGVLQKTPFSFDASVWELFVPLLAGASLVMARPGGQRDSAYLAATVVRQEVTVLQLVPTMLRVLLAEPGFAACTSLRRLFCGGEALPLDLQQRCFASLPAELHNLYGPTEVSIDVSSWLCRRDDEEAAVRIGRPIANTRIQLLDPWLRPVGVEVAGEIYAAGPGLARGYLGLPGLTAERFVPDPFGDVPGGRLYRTGDLGRWLPDGSLAFLGRTDHQVKLRGFRIELGEVEAALAALPAVSAAAVTVYEDAGGTRTLAAYAVAAAGQTPVAEELRESLGLRLPEFMVPSVVMLLDALPLTPSGKVDRVALPAPDSARQRAGAFVAPRTPVEEIIAGLYGEVLGRDRVGATDDFFGLGGHSLLAAQLVTRLRGVLGAQLSLRRIFEQPTVAGLAAEVEAAWRGAGKKEAVPPLVRCERDGPLPLSFAQQRLWFLSRLEPESPAYNLPLQVRLCGNLDRAALAASLAAVVRRHEPLRTTFPAVDGAPLQRIGAPGAWRLPLADLTGLPAARREMAAARLLAEDAVRPFDLARGPLFRSTLLQLAADDHLVTATVHHIVSDGWSTGVLVRDLSHCYRELSLGRFMPLPELPVQYADFAAWQRCWLAGEELERQLAWWRESLAGAPAALDLPTDRPRPRVQSDRGGEVPVVLPGPLAAELALRGRRAGATPFMVLLAGFSALLGRHAAQRDLVVGSPVANRNRLDTEGLIGLFVNTLALRCDLRGPAGGPTFQEHLGRLRETTLGAYAHQDLPFEKLVDELAPRRDLSRSPVFQVMLALQNSPAPNLVLPGLAVETLRIQSGVTKFDLLLTLTEGGEGIAGPLSYSRDLFDATTVARLAGHFRILLAAAAADPDLPLAALPLLTAAESAQLAAWNATDVTYPGEISLHRLVEAQERHTPDSVAVAAADEALSYGELERRAERLAGELRRLGAGPEAVVGICAERSLALLVGLLGILKAGAAYLPLDPSYPGERLALLLADAQATVVLVQPSLGERLPAHGAQVVILDPATLAAAPAAPASAVVQADNLAYVIFTSGSTGRPKGAMNTHRGIVNRLLWMQDTYRLAAQDRVLQKTPYGFDVSVWELFWPLLAGARLVMAAAGGHRDPAYLARILAREGITTVHFVPSMLRAFLDEPAAAGAGSLVRVMVSGEALAPDLRQRFFACLPGAALHNLYGPTEAAVDVTSWDCRRQAAPGTVPIGHPVANTHIHLLDDGFAPVPVGVPGNLFIAGVQLARGYFARPDLTAERFLPDPLGTLAGGRMYHTGDLARRLPDGAIEYLGRTDQQVKIRGVRIEPGEVEAVLAGHPALRAAAVVALQERGDVRLVACVVHGDEATAQPPATASALRAWLLARLPEAMVPWDFVTLETLPLLPNGKLDRGALSRTVPSVAGAAPPAAADDAPRTPVESLLAGIWAEVLGREVAGVRQSFFELGGHSLLATQVMSRLPRVFGIELPLSRLFEAPTVAELAAVVEAALRGEAGLALPPMVRIERGGELPLSFAQQRLWFIEQLKSDRGLLNIPGALRIAGDLDAGALARTLAEIVRRHEILRTAFPAVQGRPHQAIRAFAPPPLPCVDLGGLAAPSRQQEMSRILRQEARRPFDLAHGPLLRTVLLLLADREQVLGFVLHHLVSDGWSAGVIVRELSRIYPALAQGLPSPLPELSLQYADFAAWQRHAWSSAALAPHLAYWQKQLGGRLPRLELSAERPRPAVPAHRGVTRYVVLPGALARGLEDLGRRRGMTMFMLLLAAFQAWIRTLTGQDDVVVGTDVANRNRQETEGLIGFFVNQLVMRTDLSGDPTWLELLARVREVTLAAFVHQDLPFDQLVEELKLERSLKYAPLFQIKLIYQNVPAPDLALSGLSLAALDVDAGAAQLDFTLALWRTADGLRGWYNYDAELFSAAAVERWWRELTQVLNQMVARPESRLSELEHALHATERKEDTMAADELALSSFQKFKNIKPKPVTLPEERSVVKTGFLSDGATLPLVIEPALADVDVVEWMTRNKPWVEGKLHQHGALLLRGFGVDSVRRFERLSLAVCGKLHDENGEHQMISGNVATPVFYPPAQKLLWHNENSFNHSWPTRILFCCAEVPGSGGETPIVDSRQVLPRLEARLREKFLSRQVMYQRNYGGGLGLDWQTVFRTDSRAAVEDACQASHFELTWKANGLLRTHCVRPAAVRHPATGELTWFNQAQHWHVSCLDPATRESLTSLFADVDLPRHCYYGDGGAIADEEMAAVLDVYRELEVSFPWQQGDVMVLDNLLVAHARNPFEGKRKILVTLGDMSDYDQL